MTESGALRRELGIFDAVLLGLGSIVGTGVYVSLGFVLDLAGSMTVPVVVTAGLIALCNGLSSAQLASVHPVAGGTYEYGYRFLSPAWGRLAGWMFLIAKTASAATAAIGVAIAFRIVAADVISSFPSMERGAVYSVPQMLCATAVVIALGGLTHLGVRRTSIANSILVCFAIVPLIAFVMLVGVVPMLDGQTQFASASPNGVSTGSAIALAFVAFTGYGRVATLGEEVKNPRRTIPIAIVMTVLSCVVLYALVAWACMSVSSYGGGSTFQSTQPLQSAVGLWSREMTPLHGLISLGAIAAMIGVVLNLILGLSRVVLAMGRRRDLPSVFGRVRDDGRSPGWAVLLVTISIALVASAGGIKTSWTVSAITVLTYYAITNLAALKVPIEDRFVPSWVSIVGLAGCVFFAPFALLELVTPAFE